MNARQRRTARRARERVSPPPLNALMARRMAARMRQLGGAFYVNTQRIV